MAPRTLTASPAPKVSQAPSPSAPALTELADALSAALGIPFRPEGDRIAFREPLRLTDWSVPLIFDGHAGRSGDDLEPLDFVGHVLWSYMESETVPGDTRNWWTCRLTPDAGQAMVDAVRGDE